MIEELKREILELKAEMAQLKADNISLRESNNKFRLLMLTESQEPSGIYLAQVKNHWALKEPEELMTFLELFELHAKLFAELVHTKLTKEQIKTKLNERETKKQQYAKEYRERKNKTPEEKFESKIVNAADAARDKAVKHLAKTLKITYAAAEKLVDGMKFA